MQNQLPRAVRSLFAAGALLLLPACTTVAPRPGAGVAVGFPSPLSGPGRPTIDGRTQKLIRKGWIALLRARPEKALAAARRAGENGPSQLLAAQAEISRDAGDAIKTLSTIVKTYPAYAAAWLTLSVAAETAHDEAASLQAARRGATLWRSQRWRSRVADLENRWVVHRLKTARAALEHGDLETAARLSSGVLALEPGSSAAHLLEARVLLEKGKIDEAQSILSSLGNEPEALLLRGRIAERKGDWSTAMQLYEDLPAGSTRRAELLSRARAHWRIANLPRYVNEALESAQLTRAQLAVLLVDLAPQVEAFATARVPLLSDIVGLPEQREILTAVGAGLLQADTLEHQFFPARQVDPKVAERAINKLYLLLGRSTPNWCRPEESPAGCLQLVQPLGGDQIARILLPGFNQGMKP